MPLRHVPVPLALGSAVLVLEHPLSVPKLSYSRVSTYSRAEASTCRVSNYRPELGPGYTLQVSIYAALLLHKSGLFNFPLRFPVYVPLRVRDTDRFYFSHFNLPIIEHSDAQVPRYAIRLGAGHRALIEPVMTRSGI